LNRKSVFAEQTAVKAILITLVTIYNAIYNTA